MLEIRFSTLANKALISCDKFHSENLQNLRSRYISASSVSNLAFELELDDLLVNLSELAAWPQSDVDIRWDNELLRLVTSNARDADSLGRQLESAQENSDNQGALIGSDWFASLREFQKRDLRKLLELEHGANFSVPGAGKTRVTLSVFRARFNAGTVSRMLVVCPKSAFESWRNETLEFFDSDFPRVAAIDSSVIPHADIILINYERLPDARAALIGWLRLQPTMVVLDEAHRMKLGAQGAWGATCFALAPYATSRFVLSGTPAPNGAQDLENLFAFVWPGQGRRRVAQALEGNDLQTASALLRPLFVRTTKRELRLPPVDISLQLVELPPLHRELYSALLGMNSGKWRGGEDEVEGLGKILLYLLMAATTPALLATGSSRHEPLPFRIPPIEPLPGSSLNDLMRDLPQYELSPKYKKVFEIVAENASAGRKTLVWSTFVRNLKSLELMLAAFSPVVIHGGTKDREEQLRRFREDPSCFVLLSNPATLGEGVSLHHHCHDAIYVDRDFSAGRFMQSLDRIHRLGLADNISTKITILAAADTIDEVIAQRLSLKLKFMGGVLDDAAVVQLADLVEEPSSSVGMNDEDFNALVQHLNTHASC